MLRGRIPHVRVQAVVRQVYVLRVEPVKKPNSSAEEIMINLAFVALSSAILYPIAQILTPIEYVFLQFVFIHKYLPNGLR